jgi:hypothetical protein
VNEPAVRRQKAFQRVVFITRDDLLGARWWHEEMAAALATASPNRRAALKLLIGMGGLVGAVLVFRAGCNALDEPEITMDALDLQRKEGWAVGAQSQHLIIPDLVTEDSSHNADFQPSLATLAQDLAPGDARLAPYYVPTLFEVFGNPRGAGLATVIRPMHSVAMDVAQHAAEALAALFGKEEERKKTALILDMPGPLSVAAAAGVARVFAPVFLYDNWPHPMGVVPSEQTLAAAIYHRPDLLAARAERTTPAPPAFVLDNRRLSPYRDQSDRFDNRYLARMPTAANLATLGIERVLYVTAAPEPHELDDLNDDLVAMRNKSIDVKMIALSDFAPAPEALLAGSHLPATDRNYYYGGHPTGHFLFWSSYGWHSPSGTGRTFSGSLPRTVSTGQGYTPVARPTMFSSRSIGGLGGVGKQKPSGFGRVSYRSGGSGSSGSFGRSGSLGRSRSGSFG